MNDPVQTALGCATPKMSIQSVPTFQETQEDDGMTLDVATPTDWPHWQRWVLILIATLILCSCRSTNSLRPTPLPSPGNSGGRVANIEQSRQPAAAQTAPYQDRAVQPVQYATPCPPPCPAPGFDPPQGYNPGAQWAPPGLRRPWPHDEYIRDGGDREYATKINPNWRVRGLDIEDTVVHYDTLDGNTLVTPSNRVHIYAPRFAAVRKTYGLFQHEQHACGGVLYSPEKLVRYNEVGLVSDMEQPVQANREVGSKGANIFLDPLRTVDAGGAQRVTGFEGGLRPYENFEIIRLGIFSEDEKPQLAKHIEAAAAWEEKQAVQVMSQGRQLTISSVSQVLEGMHQYTLPPGRQRVRIVKVASKKDALPGEIIEFTLRFDNVGDQAIGNVTVLDNLSPRLAFIPGSAKCSVQANFRTEENERGSHVLRWEIIAPLKVGEGGVIHFQCRVR